MLFLGAPFNSMLLITFCMMFLIKMHLHTSQNSITITMPTFITSPFKIKSNTIILLHQYATLEKISQIGDRTIAFYSPKWLV